MAKTIRFTVTAADIAKGCPYDPYNCPIAWAVQRRIPGAWVECGYRGIYIDTRKEPRLSIPREAKQFMENFDFSQDVKPFSFDAEIL